MFWIFSTALLIIIQWLFLRPVPVAIWPEIYLLSFLVSQGRIPYKDFFDHHGFFAPLILSAFAHPPSFTQLNLFFFCLQSVNLFLFLLILKRITHGFWQIIYGVLFICITFFFTRNIFWYESIITTCFLAVYYLLHQKQTKWTDFFIGTSCAFASFIKPTALVILLPVLIATKRIAILVVVLLWWALTIAIYSWFWALPDLITSLFVVNSYLATHYHGPPIGDDRIYLSGILFLSLISPFLAGYKRHVLLPLAITLISLIFLQLGYGREHMTPLVTFALLTLAWTHYHAQRKRKLLLVFTVLFLLVFFVRKSTTSAIIYKKERELPSPPLPREMSALIQKKHSLFIWGDRYDLYYSLGKIPPTSFPIKFPLIDEYFPNYYEQTITTLKERGVDYILIETPQKKEYANFPELEALIQHNYTLLWKNDTLVLFRKNESY